MKTTTFINGIFRSRHWMYKIPKETYKSAACFQSVRGLLCTRVNIPAHDSGPIQNILPQANCMQRLRVPKSGLIIRYISLSEERLKEMLSAADMKKAMDQLTEQFMEARELIDDARESMETVYFSEDMAEAQEAVSSTLAQYQKLLDQLSEEQRQDVLRTIGLRMEELKAQEQALKDALHESH